jgi:predicted CXXCH cytochrome family protein
VFYSAGSGTGETGINYRQTSPGTASQTTNTPAVIPTVTLDTPASITSSSALLGGNVTADGGAAVTVRGIVWNTDTPAESAGTPNFVPIGSGTGPFSQTVGLPAGTLIYVKAYATNSVDTSYSAVEESFTTLVGLPTVTIDPAVPLTATTATFSGEVTADGGATVTDRGTVWGTSPNPVGNSLQSGSGLGIFTHERVLLPAGTLVYYRAYATNSAGTAYSVDRSFTPSGPPETVDPPPAATSITHNSAILGGEITSDGGSPILARGTVWNTTGTPTIADNPLAEGGISIGVPFSHTRTGLPSGTSIFYRSYATNSSGTGYSANDATFTTETEPTVQASNITFPKVSGRSMRISWTRGNGDGSIVVMRLGALADPGIQLPPDGADYAANSDYTLASELPVNSQNFVVYQGPDNNVWVTGLVLDTDYSVAIYEYAGTGPSTDYLQLLPAEADQKTTTVPVHNEDNRADCSGCHSHGQWFARDTVLKDVCITCHNVGGTAEAKQEFDNHLTPGKNPAIDFVDCGLCHELHTPGGSNTTESLNNVTGATQLNKSFLRANVDKYVSTAVPPAYLHTDQPLREDPHPDAPQLAVTPDRAVEGGLDAIGPSTDQQARGFCQVCHTLTNNHTNNPSTSGSDQDHDGESNTSGLGTETNCGTCHQHKSKFAGIGGTASCESCHSSEQGSIPRPIITIQFDRLSSHITGGSAVAVQEDCMVCHDQSTHQTQFVRLYDADDGVTSFGQTNAGASPTATGEGEIFAPGCLSCHDTNGASSLPAYAGDTAGQTDSSPFNGSATPPVIDSTAWGIASHNRLVENFPTTPVTCLGDGANGCHASGHGTESNSLLASWDGVGDPATNAPLSPANFCFNCHDADGPSSIDMTGEFTATVPQEYIDGPAYDTVNKQHDVLPADQTFSGSSISCKNCHDPHANSTDEPVAVPGTQTALGNYSPTGSYSGDVASFAYGVGGDISPVNPQGIVYTEPDNVKFCLTCHDGTAPAGLTMPGTMLNIATSWATSQHGAGSSRSTQKGWLKYPFTNAPAVPAPADFDDGTTPYAAMNCTSCHAAHGSENIYNLRSSINIAGIQMSVGATNAWELESGTTYNLPLDSKTGLQESLGWGAWCTFCHDVNHDTKDGFGCQSSHVHGASGNF